MVSNPRSAVSDRTNLTLIRNDRKTRQKPSRSMFGTAISTAVALMVLAAVLRYLPPNSRTAQVQAGHPAVAVAEAPSELQLGSLQISKAYSGDVLYVDGVVTNTGSGKVTGAIVEVNFHDSQGKVVGTEKKPIVGMAHGGTDLVQNEFAKNPIRPNEMRFFRVAIEPMPRGWNQEVPEVKIVAVKAE